MVCMHKAGSEILHQLLLRAQLFIYISCAGQRDGPIVGTEIDICLLAFQGGKRGFPDGEYLYQLARCYNEFVLPPYTLPRQVTERVVMGYLVQLLFHGAVCQVETADEFSVLMLLEIAVDGVVAP